MTHIALQGVVVGVAVNWFEPVAGHADAIDEAYRRKYNGSPYLAAMIGSRARAATMKIVPRSTNAAADHG